MVTKIRSGNSISALLLIYGFIANVKYKLRAIRRPIHLYGKLDFVPLPTTMRPSGYNYPKVKTINRLDLDLSSIAFEHFVMSLTVQELAGEFSPVHADDWFASPITAELDQSACPKSGTNRKSTFGGRTICREQRSVNFRTSHRIRHRAESLDEPDRTRER